MSDYRFGPFWISIDTNEVRSTRDLYLGPYTYRYSISCQWFVVEEAYENNGKFISVGHALEHAKNELREMFAETIEDMEK